VTATKPREGLWLAQTPQVFRRDLILKAYAERSKAVGMTDDAQLVEALGHPVHVVAGSTTNLKITTHDDLLVAEAVIKGRPKPKKQGYHPFAEDAKW
jgi:2-C-methyl-D-erythritol 4-phosphate cytidylyltransferase